MELLLQGETLCRRCIGLWSGVPTPSCDLAPIVLSRTLISQLRYLRFFRTREMGATSLEKKCRRTSYLTSAEYCDTHTSLATNTIRFDIKSTTCGNTQSPLSLAAPKAHYLWQHQVHELWQLTRRR